MLIAKLTVFVAVTDILYKRAIKQIGDIMRKIAEKVILVALICITFVFALTTILYVTNVIPQEDVSNNSVAVILLSVLAAIYVGLATYLIYVNFSERLNVKRILLFYDAESATRASSKVSDNIVKGCAKQVENIKVRKTTLRVDEKQGLIATVHVEVSAESVTQAIPMLHDLLIQNFQETLGLKFNTINFEIDKLTNKFVPVTKEATVETVETPLTAEVPVTAETPIEAAETPVETMEATVVEESKEQTGVESKLINVDEYVVADQSTTTEENVDEKKVEEGIE